MYIIFRLPLNFVKASFQYRILFDSVYEDPIQLEKCDKQLDIRGVAKVQYESNTKKLHKNQIVRIVNGQMILVNDKNEEVSHYYTELVGILDTSRRNTI